MISVEQAESIILEQAGLSSAEACELTGAYGRVLREDILADRDLPPFDRVTMDGIAIAFAAWRGGRTRFRIQDTARAGQPPLALKDRDQCIQVMTGSVLPDGCDCVVPYEHLGTDENEASIVSSIKLEKMQCVQRQGSDRKSGSRLLNSGCVLRSPQVAIIASIGKATVLVGKAPSVAVVSNGDELAALGKRIAPHQIRPSNSYAIQASLRSVGCSDLSAFTTRDDQKQIERVLRPLIEQNDIVAITGGTSVGKFDFVPSVLRSLGVKEIFHRVSQRPGKPLWFGIRKNKGVVFALPGNPVSSLICLHRYVLPYVWSVMGITTTEAEYVDLGEPMSMEEALTHFLPVRLNHREDGSRVALPVPYFGSGDCAALGESDGFIEVPPSKRPLAVGRPVRYHPWRH